MAKLYEGVPISQQSMSMLMIVDSMMTKICFATRCCINSNARTVYEASLSKYNLLCCALLYSRKSRMLFNSAHKGEAWRTKFTILLAWVLIQEAIPLNNTYRGVAKIVHLLRLLT